MQPGDQAEIPRTSPAANAPEPPASAAADSVEALVKPWITSRLAAFLISVGVPGSAAGLVSGAAVWLVMRRGRRRLEDRLKQLGAAPATSSSAASTSAAGSSGDSQVVERHHNRYVPYELSELDKAWAAAHAHVGEKYPGAVPYLKIAEGVKEQLLSGIKDPTVS